MRLKKEYDNGYKVQAVKLAEEIGTTKAIKELGIPDSTFYTWLHQSRDGELDTGDPVKPQTAKRLATENKELQKRIKAQETEIREKDRVIACLKEATAFFAASQKR